MVEQRRAGRRLSRWTAPAALLGIAGLVLAGCAGMQAASAPPPAAPRDEAVPVELFVAGDALEKPWRKVPIWREASYTLASVGEGVAIRAVAEGASAVLARGVEIDIETCPVIEWTWRVDSLPSEADLASRRAEDVAASLSLAFGDPGAFTNPDPVPTVRYVWATDGNAEGEVIDSPYFPGTIHSLVVESGPARLGEWVTVRRDLLADFGAVFGGVPDEDLQVIALFTDSDHGEDRVEAFYREARMLCRAVPEEPSIFG